ncbi:MAG: hypothetical protein ACLGSD_00385 [Acidobacteriota bacterium]
MQEVLSKTVDPKAPLEGQEFYELRIDDSDDIWRPGFIVVEAHAAWSVADKQIVWDESEFERCETYAQAKDRYEARRRALTQKGFIYSDMDPLL